MKRKIANKLCIVAFFWGVLIFMAACSDSKKDWSKMSPAEIVERYLAARNSGDTATIRKITYFSPEETEAEIERKIQSAVASAEEKGTLRIFGVKTKVEYGKVIDSNTAEAGIIMDAVIGRRTPLMQVVLKRDEGIWKYHYSKSELTDEQLREMIKRNPPDPDAIYLLGRKMIASNRKRATRYFMKYKELAPDGFWISSSMNDHIKNNALLDPYEEEKRLQPIWASIPDRSINKLFAYLSMAQMFWETGNKEKTQQYIEKGDALIQKYPKEFPAHCQFVIRYYKDKKQLEEEMKQGKSGDSNK